MFRREETALPETDAGWALAPSYSRQRPLGSATDVITTLAIGSAERAFECFLTPNRFKSLEFMLNTKALFTDWEKPIPDSRMAFLSEVTLLDSAIITKSFEQNISGGTNGSLNKYMTQRIVRTRVVLISA